MKGKRFLRVCSLGLLLAMLASGCGANPGTSSQAASGSQPSSQITTQGEARTELRVGVQSFVTNVGAQSAESNAAAQVLYNIYDTLVMRQPDSGEQKIIPGLAESWEQQDDRTWIFHLRSGVQFHDGSILTAEDVAYSLNRVINQEDPLFSSVYAKFMYNFEPVEVVDDLTVKITTKQPDPLVLSLLSDPNTGITSKAYVESVGLEESILMPISTAPYQVTEFVPNEKLVLERFENYWGEQAPLEKITYTLIPEISSRITALVNDEVDFIVSVPPDQEATVSGNSDVKLVGTAWPMYHVLVLNQNGAGMEDPKLRQAMSLAIDRQALVDAIWGGKAIAAQSLQFEDYGSPMYMPEIQTEIYDLEKAKQLVAESSYNGELLTIYNQTNYYTYADLALQAIIEMWKEAGINAELVQVDKYPDDYSQISARTWSNPLHYPDPMGVMSTHWTENSWPYTKGFFNITPEWQTQYDLARYSTDTQTRKDAYTALLTMMQEDPIALLLYQPYEAFAMSQDIAWEVPVAYRPYTLAFRAGEISF